MANNILGLDLAMKYGFAVIDADTEKLVAADFRDDRKLPKGERFANFGALLSALTEEFQIKGMAMEHLTFFTSTSHSQSYGGFNAIAHLHAQLNEVPCMELPVGTWKRIAIGKGNAKKPEIRRYMKDKYGFKKLPQEDSADAMGVALAAIRSWKEQAAFA